MNDLKRTILKFPVLGSLYVNWKRQRNIRALRQKETNIWLQHPYGQASVERLKAYHNKHQGERCFVIGNGPSLNKMELSYLKNEYTFGANRIYLLFEELGFTTSYFCSVNTHVIEQFAEDIAELPMPKFLSWRAKDSIQFTDDMMFLRPFYEENFQETPIYGLWEGATVTFISLQLAYYMGFKEVYLIGVDHNFKDKGVAHKLVTSEGDDENHFHPDYFHKGIRWQLPDLDTSEIAYLMARQYYEDNGRKIMDATVGGKLQIFDKVSYDDLF
ncbi:MAG: DUF115 domain-containing protein [Phototrophicaceae bacterium]